MTDGIPADKNMDEEGPKVNRNTILGNAFSDEQNVLVKFLRSYMWWNVRLRNI